MAPLVVAMRTMQHVLARIGTAALVAGGPASGHAALVRAAPVGSGAVERSASPTAASTIYVIEAAGTDPQLLQALMAARAQLQGQGVELVVASVRPDETAAQRARTLVAGGLARGVFWFDQRSPEELRVFLLTADGSAYVRRVPVEPTSAEASREAVWLIVESGSVALASGQRVAMEQATEALEPEPEPEPAPPEPEEPGLPTAVLLPPEADPPPRRVRVRLELGYRGEGLATAVPWSSGAGLDVALELGPRWRLALGYGLLLPWRGGDPAVTWRHRGELRLGPRFAVGSRLELFVLAGAGIDGLRWRATASDDTGLRMAAVATLDGGIGLRLHPTLWLVLEPGAGVVLNRFDFIECAAGEQTCEGAQRRVVLAPWRARPRARLGLHVVF